MRSMPTPLKMSGSEISRIEALIIAIKDPSILFESASPL